MDKKSERIAELEKELLALRDTLAEEREERDYLDNELTELKEKYRWRAVDEEEPPRETEVERKDEAISALIALIKKRVCKTCIACGEQACNDYCEVKMAIEKARRA